MRKRKSHSASKMGQWEHSPWQSSHSLKLVKKKCTCELTAASRSAPLTENERNRLSLSLYPQRTHTNKLLATMYMFPAAKEDLKREQRGNIRPEREPPGHWMNKSDSENKRNESICPDQEMPCRTCSTTSSVTSFFFSEGFFSACRESNSIWKHLHRGSNCTHITQVWAEAPVCCRNRGGDAKVFKIFSVDYWINIFSSDTAAFQQDAADVQDIQQNLLPFTCNSQTRQEMIEKLNLGECPNDK